MIEVRRQEWTQIWGDDKEVLADKGNEVLAEKQSAYIIKILDGS